MSISALPIVTTVFSYFSPTKSPYYAVISFGTVGLVLARNINETNWLIIFLPIYLTLLVSTVLSLRSRPEFTSEEYNNQLRFARSFGISSAILCLAFTGLRVESFDDQGELVNRWFFWSGYLVSLLQIVVFLLYIFIYHNYDARQSGRNFIQISLVTSSFLIGATYTVTERFDSESTPFLATLLGLYALWTICIAYLTLYLAQNFQLVAPEDATPQRSPAEETGVPATEPAPPE
ncbi:hypothetical protein [Pelagibius marinus]|uniref:hypothetical protein n=1 Tax=Pelagibius marinus TaxID=2762760 RepID=UPI001872A1AC|nr:hypothetical protein [Pelagibius marinus]